MGELSVSERWTLLGETVRAIAQASTAGEIVDQAQAAGRRLANADGITIVKRIGSETDYVAEDAVEPLWAGLQFPIDKCLAGRAILQRRPVIIEDITQAGDIPLNVYLSTFVRSLIAVPIGQAAPTYAICAYWRIEGPIDLATQAIMIALARAMAAGFTLAEITELSAANAAGHD